ncbi:ion channel [Mucisphaera calidilacus]|uniref:Voltage-gated potassium channel n=1 Tax=Mucisphaera calidilacus TaxID=2527982 RepID=A0A518BVV2_9BACT|nr:ion channel [Mucisphaera calidilacus]QDU71091.1 voltage-gated potassium channel [Mucisphaera calidilacus]
MPMQRVNAFLAAFLIFCRRHRTISYALLGILFFLLTALSQLDVDGSNLWLIKTALTLVIAFAIIAVSVHRWLLTLSIVLAAFYLVSLWQRIPEHWATLTYTIDLAGTLFFLLITAELFRYVIAGSEINRARVFAAVTGYLISIWFFAGTYTQIARHNPDAFTNINDIPQTRLISEMVYFSVVTQTTLGYGDIAPLSGRARALVVAQALFGVLYLAVAIARIVGLVSASRQHDLNPPRNHDPPTR